MPAAMKNNKPHPSRIILTGKRFGRWRVLRAAHHNSSGALFWDCICDCGTMRSIIGATLRNGQSLSCGCLCKERTSAANRKHGKTGSKEYCCWVNMRRRCNDPNNPAYHNYGGRGICVCPQWSRFEVFLSDMGPSPSDGHTIERKDNDGNYEPTNCIWILRNEQSRNRRGVRFLTVGKQTKLVSDWSKEAEIRTGTIRSRVDSGRWTPEDAVTYPTMRHGISRNTIVLTLDGISLTLPEWSRRLNIRKQTLWKRLKRGWSEERTLKTPTAGCYND